MSKFLLFYYAESYAVLYATPVMLPTWFKWRIVYKNVLIHATVDADRVSLYSVWQIIIITERFQLHLSLDKTIISDQSIPFIATQNYQLLAL